MKRRMFLGIGIAAVLACLFAPLSSARQESGPVMGVTELRRYIDDWCADNGADPAAVEIVLPETVESWPEARRAAMRMVSGYYTPAERKVYIVYGNMIHRHYIDMTLRHEVSHMRFHANHPDFSGSVLDEALAVYQGYLPYEKKWGWELHRQYPRSQGLDSRSVYYNADGPDRWFLLENKRNEAFRGFERFIDYYYYGGRRHTQASVDEAVGWAVRQLGDDLERTLAKAGEAASGELGEEQRRAIREAFFQDIRWSENPADEAQVLARMQRVFDYLERMLQPGQRPDGGAGGAPAGTGLTVIWSN